MLQLKQKNADSRPQWLVESRYTFGTDTDNHYTLSGVGVQAVQASLDVNVDNLVLTNLAGDDGVTLNGKLLKSNSVLKPGDEFSIGETSFVIEDPKSSLAQNVNTPHFEETNGWSLKAKNTALANKSFKLDGSQSIGRSNDCDICLNVVHLSRKHAKITVTNDGIQIDDLNSSNGTYVNGEKVDSALAKAGDEIAFDTLRFTVVGPVPASDQTQLRADATSNATTVRPALTEQQIAAFANKNAMNAKKNRTPPSSAQANPTANVTSPQTPATKPEASNKSTSLLVGLIGVTLLAIAIYVFTG